MIRTDDPTGHPALSVSAAPPGCEGPRLAEEAFTEAAIPEPVE